MLPKLYTLNETADALRMSASTLKQIKSKGDIGFYKRPGAKGAVLFSEEHINAYLKHQCSL